VITIDRSINGTNILTGVAIDDVRATVIEIEVKISVNNQIMMLGTKRSAGSNVKIVKTAEAIPIAPTGPRPAEFESWLKSSIKSEIATVEPEARIGSHTPRYAARIASKRLS
jgi:hypothetical protein